MREKVRRFGAHGIAPKGQKVEDKSLLGQPTHLAGKPKGESSMSAKRGSAKSGSVVVPASPARRAKPVLVEPQFPVAQLIARRSHSEAVKRSGARRDEADGMTSVGLSLMESPLR